MPNEFVHSVINKGVPVKLPVQRCVFTLNKAVRSDGSRFVTLTTMGVRLPTTTAILFRATAFCITSPVEKPAISSVFVKCWVEICVQEFTFDFKNKLIIHILLYVIVYLKLKKNVILCLKYRSPCWASTWFFLSNITTKK